MALNEKMTVAKRKWKEMRRNSLFKKQTIPKVTTQQMSISENVRTCFFKKKLYRYEKYIFSSQKRSNINGDHFLRVW